MYIYIMKRIICIVFILSHLLLGAQNLVPNGSFENYTSCPSASGQLTLAINWVNPSTGTPDYFNNCSLPMGIPYSGFGFQYANFGNAVAGIWAFCNTTSNIREYIQCQLTNTLTANNFYLVEYYTNRSNWSDYACNNISCLLSGNSTFTSGTNGLITANPQITKFNNDVIIDTLNWIKVSAIYQATGGENYITIGNFKNDALTTYSNVVGAPNNFCAAYYYVDDVSLTNITTPQWQYRDTTIYLGDSVLIGPAVTGLNVDWFDAGSTFIKNAPGIYVKPIVTTPYQATETFNSVVYNHTVTVTVLMPVKVDEYNKLQNSFRLFPNPNNGNFSLQFDDLKNGDIEINISDVTGKIVYENKLQRANTLVNLDVTIKEGVYFVKIINLDSKAQVVKKIIINK